MIAGITAALSVGSTNPDVVAVEARKAAEHPGAAPASGPEKANGDEVISLARRRLTAELPGDGRPLPTVDKYDVLLRRTGSA